jgi:hypothetical protein
MVDFSTGPVAEMTMAPMAAPRMMTNSQGCHSTPSLPPMAT